MIVEKLTEHADGSATVIIEMDEKEKEALIEEGFVSMLKKSIEHFKETCPDATKYKEENPLKKQNKRKTKKNV